MMVKTTNRHLVIDPLLVFLYARSIVGTLIGSCCVLNQPSTGHKIYKETYRSDGWLKMIAFYIRRTRLPTLRRLDFRSRLGSSVIARFNGENSN
jgi:hypothetical protein